MKFFGRKSLCRGPVSGKTNISPSWGSTIKPAIMMEMPGNETIKQAVMAGMRLLRIRNHFTFKIAAFKVRAAR